MKDTLSAFSRVESEKREKCGTSGPLKQAHRERAVPVAGSTLTMSHCNKGVVAVSLSARCGIRVPFGFALSVFTVRLPRLYLSLSTLSRLCLCLAGVPSSHSDLTTLLKQQQPL